MARGHLLAAGTRAVAHRRARCRRCQVRARRTGEGTHGLCLRCAREEGILPPSLMVKPLDRPVTRIETTPRPPLRKVIAGREYQIVWDGA